jgi:NADPH:quinone reductase-like Zn-dependent oxidoreductase
MKAIFYHKFGERDVLEFGEIAEPIPHEKQLLIEVERSSVNYVDIRERQGTYNRPETHGGEIKLPHIPGLQAVRRVTAAGSASDRAWVGKKVLAYVTISPGCFSSSRRISSGIRSSFSTRLPRRSLRGRDRVRSLRRRGWIPAVRRAGRA